jgi:hypothetical protein
MVDWLLAHGAALDLPDALSKTPPGTAQEAITASTPAQTEVRERVISTLEAHGAVPHAFDEERRFDSKRAFQRLDA